MTEYERRSTGLANGVNELRRLIIENPDLPLLIFAGEDATLGGYWTSCSTSDVYLGEFLDCKQMVDEEHIFADRIEFEEALVEYNDSFEGSDEEFDEFIAQELAEYEPYWRKCIILYVDN